MKRLISMTCLIPLLLALLAGAKAQETINFGDLPLVSVPSPMPNGYGQLQWSNFFYVDPYNWSGAGTGFRHEPQPRDVAFIGARVCRLVGYACLGTLSDPRGFQLVSAKVAGGFGSTPIIVSAYNNGALLGSANYFLTTDEQTLNFPSRWGVATDVVIQVFGATNSMVVYELNLYTLGG